MSWTSLNTYLGELLSFLETMAVQHFNHGGNLAKWASGTGLLWRWRNKPHAHPLLWPLKEFSPEVPILTPEQGELQTGGGHGRGWEDEEGSCVQSRLLTKHGRCRRGRNISEPSPGAEQAEGLKGVHREWASGLHSSWVQGLSSNYLPTKRALIFFLVTLYGMRNLSLPTKDLSLPTMAPPVIEVQSLNHWFSREAPNGHQ